MAMVQAEQVRALLTDLDPRLEVEIEGIQTSGDRWQGDLAVLGGKGAFLKEIERSLVAGDIDVAVHCVKDVPGDVPIPEGTTFAAYLPRDDVRDVLVFPAGSSHTSLDDLPTGARVATSSVRRRAQLLRVRPDLRVERIRGNVNSRFARFDAEGRFDAMILAWAGLRRLGMDDRVGQVLPVDVMCPAVGAGVLGVQCRTADERVLDLVRRLDHTETRAYVTAERAMLHGLQGHCNSPIAGHCTATPDGHLSLIGVVFGDEGEELAYACAWDIPTRARELGVYVAEILAEKGARQIIAGTQL